MSPIPTSSVLQSTLKSQLPYGITAVAVHTVGVLSQATEIEPARPTQCPRPNALYSVFLTFKLTQSPSSLTEEQDKLPLLTKPVPSPRGLVKVKETLEVRFTNPLSVRIMANIYPS